MKQSNLKTRAALLAAGALAAVAIAWAVLGLASAGETRLGDANCDGRIDSIDALLVLQLHAGLIEEVCGDVDVNRDRVVNSVDAALILQNSIVEPLPGPGPFPQPTPSEPPELTTRLSLADLPGNEGIIVTLTLLNNNIWPLERGYADGQDFDVFVHDADGNYVWNFWHEQPWTQAVESHTFAPGGILRHHATWRFEDKDGTGVGPGTYELEAFDVGCTMDPARQCDLGETIAVDIPPPPDCAGKDGLGADLIVSGGRETFTSGENVSLTLVLYNCGEEAINRVYSDARQYGFVVQDESGEIVRRWSPGATLAVTDRTFEPDEMFVHRTIWQQDRVNRGDLVAPGTYTASGFDVSTCRFNSLDDCDLIASQTIEILLPAAP